MLKKLWLAMPALLLASGLAFAQVDVNKADPVALDGIKGIGPATSRTIVDERKKGGDFKHWADFESRVKGVGGKKAAALSAAGLTVNGATRPADATAGKKAKDMKTADAGTKPQARK
jgi:competence protein ComEA